MPNYLLQAIYYIQNNCTYGWVTGLFKQISHHFKHVTFVLNQELDIPSFVRKAHILQLLQLSDKWMFFLNLRLLLYLWLLLNLRLLLHLWLFLHLWLLINFRLLLNWFLFNFGLLFYLWLLLYFGFFFY